MNTNFRDFQLRCYHKNTYTIRDIISKYKMMNSKHQRTSHFNPRKLIKMKICEMAVLKDKKNNIYLNNENVI
jgi:hypothetical protein